MTIKTSRPAVALPKATGLPPDGVGSVIPYLGSLSVQPFRRTIDPITIGMPQLGPYGLSEGWLLRHLGDLHWSGICEGLGRASRDMVDLLGNRLYASFVRVRWHSTRPLAGYRESDELTGWIEMSRCGDGVFFSNSELANTDADGTITVELATMFTRREGLGNDRLVISVPPPARNCPIPDVDIMPPFVEQHRSLRGGKTLNHRFMSLDFDIASPIEESIDYQINGYQDFNGANLLYFASYPTIADICASQTQYVADEFGFAQFVQALSPIGRDLFYFGNANLGDTISCRFQIREPGFAGLLSARVDLFRRETETLIGQQFVIRKKADHR